MNRVLSILLILFSATMARAAVVPDNSDFFPGLDEDSMLNRLAHADLQPLEGIWYYPAEEMTLGIERCPAQGHDKRYRIIMLGSTDVHLMPGTVIGYLQASATTDKWRLWLYSERDKLTLCRPMETVATLNSDCSSITFDRPHWRVKVRINFARFLPTIFRGVSIIPDKEEERLPIGFRKIYPEVTSSLFTHIRYL